MSIGFLHFVVDSEKKFFYLAQHNLSMEWLEEKLREKKVSVSDVAYASVNDLGQLYMDLRNDNPENKVEISD